MTTPSGSMPSTPAGVPVPPAGAGPDEHRSMVTVATFPDYASAQRAIDFLSDEKFPVEQTAIVGTNLRLVENVLGRMTTARSAVAGAASGAWFGLFIGFLFGIFSSSNWFAVLVVAVLIGAIWGAIFGAVAHSMTRGRRDFTSRSTLVASEYAISVQSSAAEEARQLLVRLNWRTNTAGQA